MPVIGDDLNFGTDLLQSLEAFRRSEVHWIMWEFRTSREVGIVYCSRNSLRAFGSGRTFILWDWPPPLNWSSGPFFFWDFTDKSLFPSPKKNNVYCSSFSLFLVTELMRQFVFHFIRT